MRWGFVVLVGVTAVLILLILSGVNDPQPVGELVGERPLLAQTIPAQTEQLTWLEDPLPSGRYSLRLTAAREDGETDIGYGLALGREDEYLAVAVSPLGYLSVWQKKGQETDTILPWQTWPHVGRGLEPNEIWLDVDDLGRDDLGRLENGRLTIRINREFLWAGEIEPPSGQIGLIGESFGETAVVDFQTLQIFTEDDQE